MGDTGSFLRSRKATLFFVFLAAAGIAARVWTWSGFDRGHFCVADFPAYYSGAKLLGTPSLYSAKAVQEVQEREMGCTSPSSAFTRPPFFAAMLWPFIQLPFTAAFFTWGAVGLLALIGFVWLWEAPKAIASFFCAWCLPLSASFTAGQDATVLLLWLAAAAALVRLNKDFAAGMVLSLCAAKFQLFLLLPVLIAARRQWKLAYGLLGGIGLLLATSFALAGWRWPVDYYLMLRDAPLEPYPWEMVNLRGVLYGVPGAMYWEILVALSVVAVCWRVVRHGSFPVALSVTVAGGLLVSHHAHLPDATLLLIPALTLPFQSFPAPVKVLAVAPMIPLTWFLAAIPALHRTPMLVPLVLLSAMGLVVRRGRGRVSEAEE